MKALKRSTQQYLLEGNGLKVRTSTTVFAMMPWQLKFWKRFQAPEPTLAFRAALQGKQACNCEIALQEPTPRMHGGYESQAVADC